MAPARCCVPGERLCSLEDCAPGYGTYCKHGYVFSSLSGYVVKKTNNGLMPVISVVRDTDSHLLPDVGSVVTCKVMSINPRFAKVQIMYIGAAALKNTFRGTIRKEDIRATEKDKGLQQSPIYFNGAVLSFSCTVDGQKPKRTVEVYKSFRPGDIVVAKVISLGDAQSNYLLTTAENELGVVVAHSEAGATMVPISWCEMQCPKTHMKEPRKVARVQPEFLQT